MCGKFATTLGLYRCILSFIVWPSFPSRRAFQTGRDNLQNDCDPRHHYHSESYFQPIERARPSLVYFLVDDNVCNDESPSHSELKARDEKVKAVMLR